MSRKAYAKSPRNLPKPLNRLAAGHRRNAGEMIAGGEDRGVYFLRMIR